MKRIVNTFYITCKNTLTKVNFLHKMKMISLLQFDSLKGTVYIIILKELLTNWITHVIIQGCTVKCLCSGHPVWLYSAFSL